MRPTFMNGRHDETDATTEQGPCAAHMQCQHVGLVDSDYLGSLLLGHGSRDGAIPKAMLPQFAFQPLNGPHKLAEHQRLG